MANSKKTRDTGIELARILGCLIVIGCHSYLPVIVDDKADFNRTLVAMFCADGVTVFWLILGFFLFGQKDYKRLCKHTASRIIVPVLVFSIFLFYFLPYINGSVPTLWDSLRRPKAEYLDAFRTLIRWTPIQGAAHLWYLYVYVLVILIFPALSGMVQCMENDSAIRKRVLAVSALIFAANTYTGNQLMYFSHNTIGGMVPASMIAIFGHFIYKHKYFLRKYGIWAPLVFLGLNWLRAKIYLCGFQLIMYWYTVSGILSAVCVISFAMAVVARMRNEKLTGLINFAASYTFNIYIIHFVTITLLNRLHFNAFLFGHLSGLPDGVVDILYPGIYGIVVFAISLVFAVLIRYVYKLFKRCLVMCFHAR